MTLSETLAQEPTLQGSLRVTVELGPDGKVHAAKPQIDSNQEGDRLNEALVGCVTRRLLATSFEPPESLGASKFVIPITFRRR